MTQYAYVYIYIYICTDKFFLSVYLEYVLSETYVSGFILIILKIERQWSSNNQSNSGVYEESESDLFI